MALTLSHWGLYETTTGKLRPHADDPDPSPIGLDQLAPETQSLRVRRPAVRRGWLEGRRGARAGHLRGCDSFVEMDWEEVIPLLADEIAATIATSGNSAIFAGSYGWASAGRFHHAQGQVHRFFNTLGGYTAHRNSYSHAAISVVAPHVVGDFDDLLNRQTSWPVMAEHTGLFVAFGGVPTKNAQVSSGGVVAHVVRDGMRAIAQRGKVVSISPLKADMDAVPEAEWIAIRPNTDVALMLGLMHTLLEEGLHDSAFLARYCVGFETVVLPYLRGQTDGVAKTALWAEGITGVPAARIVALAREMAATRTMLNAAWALQRALHGEQVYWALITLAAMLGQIGLPGGGFGLGYGSANSIGSAHGRSPGPTLSQGVNPTGSFIPVARIADMLENPGGAYDYDGMRRTYPAIDMIYWAGGNPFHHHQDLDRLRRAFRRPETVVSHEQYWTPMARMADIVLPATLALERNDLGFSGREGALVPMKRMTAPLGAARDDYAIFAMLADRLGVGPAFTEGRDEMAWLAHLYADWAAEMGRRAPARSLPDFETFWREGALLPTLRAADPIVFLSEFRADPEAHPLATPSGRIELFSARVAAFGYADAPGHAVWRDKPLPEADQLHLISHQPQRKLHSQLDHAPHSRAGKIAGREPLRLNPADIARLGLVAGHVVKVTGPAGSCLGALVADPDVMAGTAVMATGAWYDPADWSADTALECHGNPNAVIADVPTSPLAMGCTAMSAHVRITPIPQSEIPPVSAHDLPRGITS